MTADEAVVAVLDALDAAGMPYMIVGSLASNFHGIPRSTRDADFVVEVQPGGLDRLGDALPPGLALQRQGSFEVVTGTTRYLIELAGSPFVCELFARSDDAHDRERFTRRQRVRMLDRVAAVASAEDMIVTKLRWAMEARRSKDREDIRNILVVRGPELDWAYMQRWAAVHGTVALLVEIRASI
ncbi:MAG: hypothetical protein A3H97_23360 [Acidobacteria bacterium RIFCSPLOWO2_02_FULL_65_29]|nr:MAG: hypothetical protein A3H97_23360 [Acidobacteria bacterium RIFCSPLOWO2_02_FULL_65_29]